MNNGPDDKKRDSTDGPDNHQFLPSAGMASHGVQARAPSGIVFKNPVIHLNISLVL
jgi:hypothetical protein